jgi:indole-3-pyruvate monooxygenase
LSADKQKYFGKDGLYFCGFYISPTGQIREIGQDAQKITKSIVNNARK